MAGEAVRMLDGFGRRYAVAVRLAILPPIAAIALLRASGAGMADTALVVAVAVAWTGGQGWWLYRGGRSPIALDVVVLLGLCLSVFWTDAVATTNFGWLRLLVTFACVTWQWHTPPVAGAVAAVVASGGMIVIFTAADLPVDVVQAWMLVMAGMSRAAWVLVRRAAERADRMAAEAERARREAAVATAVRAEERELANSLHDTAATTLLMIGVGQVPPDAGWLAPQARRDLARLRPDGERRPMRVDLVESLRADLDASHLTVALDLPPRLPLPSGVADAVAGAVREALNNVRRHAGTTMATVRLTGDPTALEVEISDRGKGFDHTPGTTRRGLRESVHGRMTGIGGTATITSAPGAGTMVRLAWRTTDVWTDEPDEPAPRATPSPTDDRTQEQLRRGLRIATLLLAVLTVDVLGLINLLRHLDSHDVPVAQLVAYAGLTAVLATEAVLVVRSRQWDALRWPAIAVVFAAAALSYLTLPEGRTSTTVDWMFGATGWVILVVLLDRPLRTVMTFLVAHELLALANLLLFHEVSRGTLARFATGSVTVFGLPLCVAVVAAVLGRIGTAASRAARELERVRTAEEVAAAAHRRRAQRFAELAGTTVPLLQGLADGSLLPSDPVVRRGCAIEAARMRRLFAETDTVENPLLHELRHCADIADRKGVEVELAARGRWSVPPVAVRRDLTDAALTALATADSWARVTVVGDDGLVSVSVVADCAESTPPAPATPDVRVETFGAGGTVWMEARWQPS